MELTQSPASPFVRMAVVAAHEAGVIDQVTLTPVATSPVNTAAAVAASNPLGKIPVLTRDDGGALYDSRVICRYFARLGGVALYPEAREWEVLTLEATGHGIAEAAVLMVYERRVRPENEQSETWIEAQWEKARRTLDALEARWMSHLHGPLDMGQIAVACALGYIDFRHPDRDWRAGRTALAAWYESFAARPSLEATAPTG
ncbi:MAG: glutathione S-transferase family protein [Pseudomonadota bacterium]